MPLDSDGHHAAIILDDLHGFIWSSPGNTQVSRILYGLVVEGVNCHIHRAVDIGDHRARLETSSMLHEYQWRSLVFKVRDFRKVLM